MSDKINTMEDFTSVLLVIRECFVYQIPPLMKSEGHKAANWDVSGFLWKGRLRMVTLGEKLVIRLEDPESGELFAACPYEEDGSSVEPVIDSSRYFVLRVVDQASGKHAYLGMGFTDRSEAFDFNVALQDFVRQNKNSKDVEEAFTPGPSVDYSLKEGQTISLNLAGKVGKPKARPETSDAPSKPFVLPPPPGTQVNSKAPSQNDFGSFQEASDNTADNNDDPFSNWAKFE